MTTTVNSPDTARPPGADDGQWLTSLFNLLSDGFIQGVEQLAASLRDRQPGTSELLYAYAAREVELAADLLTRWP